MSFRSGWYVLRVRLNYERKIHDILLNTSIEPFVPLSETIKQWSDRKKKIRTPLFPSYIFVNIKTYKDLYVPLNIENVYHYIRFGDEYATVSESEINKVKMLIGSDDITDISTSMHIPQLGEIIEISCGPLQGQVCEILKTNQTNKIIVRMASMKQNIIATIPLSYIL